MKVITPALILILLVASPRAVGQADASSEQFITNMIDQHLLGMINHDREVLAKMYDDGFHGVLGSGSQVDKPKMLEFLVSGSPHILLSHEEVKVTVFGNMAVVTGKILSKGKTGSVIGKSRFIHVLVKRGEDWKIIEGQSTVVVLE
ncbi:MAG: nuclear transport factor 2 family protein [Cyclobacteriaceae bacterium]|nr:nuclear transport factor 2 family protein [Cyclobacteriaceae bacterium]